MKKQEVHRDYNFPDADLYVQTMEKLRFAQRDIEAFKTYGYDMEKLTGIHNTCQKFAKLATPLRLAVGTGLLPRAARARHAQHALRRVADRELRAARDARALRQRLRRRQPDRRAPLL